MFLTADYKIFICTHKDFIVPDFCDDKYLICGDQNLKKDYNLTILKDNAADNDIYDKEYAYAENSRIHYVWKNIELDDYVGFCQYRKYLELPDDFKETITDYDVYLPKPIVCNIDEQYACCHNTDDLKLAQEIILQKFPNYSDIIKESHNNNLPLYPCNTFIFKRELFEEYCHFLFSVLFAFDRKRFFFSDADIKEYVIKHSLCYIKGINDMLPYYQSRIEGFLSERLFSYYIIKKTREEKIKVKTLNLIKTISDDAITYKKTT